MRAFTAQVVAVVLSLAWVTSPPVRGVTINPDLPPVSVPYNTNLSNVVELPFDYRADVFTVVKTAPGCSPEQVSVTYWGVDSRGQISVLVSWATCDAIVQSTAQSGDCTGSSASGIVTGPLSTSRMRSVVYYSPSRTYTYGAQSVNSSASPEHFLWAKNAAYGTPTSYVYDYSPLIKYASPILHHVVISGLQPGVSYDYIIADNVASASASFTQTIQLRPKSYGKTPYYGRFKVPGKYSGRLYPAGHGWGHNKQPSQFPLKVAVIGDPGQTYNTTDTLRHVLASNSDMLWIMADFTYADRTDLPGVVPAGCNLTRSITYPPRWDTFGRLIQPIVSRVPLMATNGNHEIEELPGAWGIPYNSNFTERDLAYNSRYPVPQFGPSANPRYGAVLPQPNAPTNVSKGTPSPNAYANLYYRADIPGVATTIWLTSYSPYDANVFTTDSEQYVWLKKQLESVDRKKTPWVVVNWHAPMYNTYTSHFKENECFREVYEPLLVQYSVDMIFLGHVHAYERTKPINNFKVDTTGCAPVHITIGDAGNVEGAANTFITPTFAGSSYNCSNPEAYSFPPYQPQRCIKYNEGPGSGCATDTMPCFCYTSQPAWSAFREPSFGHGELQFLSETTAVWKWFRNQDTYAVESDSVTITRQRSCTA